VRFTQHSIQNIIKVKKNFTSIQFEIKNYIMKLKHKFKSNLRILFKWIEKIWRLIGQFVSIKSIKIKTRVLITKNPRNTQNHELT